ncbi:sensor histidine kinase [Cohnella silvisoli]|uniref:histidine kinase n=1 Tax=Cohnella silvisoli TaxID=2873699 RepID=A0ABV1KQ53_9BACL|nr:HAMP domain-containing sensor histidine kinase [Cohnella silvisoli]MCD9022184.1 HAMP domain-containing histidine kinase [Cohnella silvisoli]
MSIRRKLLLSYAAMIIIPLILFGVSIFLASSLFIKDFTGGKASNTLPAKEHAPFAAFGQWFGGRNEMISGIKYIAKYDPRLLSDPEFIKEADAQLAKFSATIVVTIGERVEYASSSLDPGEIPQAQKHGYSAEEIPFQLENGQNGKLIVATDMQPIYNFVRKFIPTVLLALLCALILTNGVLTYVVSRSIIKPLYALKNAAEQIREGNLEHGVNLGGRGRHDEIGQLGAVFEEMRVRLKQSIGVQLQLEENRKELLANISHDLKTPITAIQGCVECLQDGVADSDEKRAKYAGMIAKKASDMDRLIDELFLYSTLDMKKQPFHYEVIELEDYLGQTIEELRIDPRLSGVEIDYGERD